MGTLLYKRPLGGTGAAALYRIALGRYVRIAGLAFIPRLRVRIMVTTDSTNQSSTLRPSLTAEYLK